MELDTKEVVRIGNSQGLILTKHLKRMGLSVGDKVGIVNDGEVMVISGNVSKILSGKIIVIENNLWKEFVSVVEKETHMSPNEAVEDALKRWIKKFSSFWDKPLWMR